MATTDRRITWLLVVAGLVAFALSVAWSGRAHAEDPGNIQTAEVYENIYEADDALVVVYVKIPTWSTQRGILRLMDGATVLQEREINAADGLYQVSGFIFEAGYSFTWGEALTLTLDGNPTDSWTGYPSQASVTFTSGYWNTSSGLVDGRNQLNAYLVARLRAIETDDSTLLVGDLITQGGSGWVTTTIGQVMILRAVPGLFAPLPSLFLARAEIVDFTGAAPGSSLQGTIDAEAAGLDYAPGPALRQLGADFGLGDVLAITAGLGLFVVGFVYGLRQGMPGLVAVNAAFPLVIFSMRASLIPLAYPMLAIFLTWMVGLWRWLRPSKETMVLFATALYVVGTILGAIMDASTGSGALDLLNNLFHLSIFNQQDPSIFGYIVALPVSTVQFLQGVFKVAFWDFAFWNDLGIVKWILWLPFFGSFAFMVLSTLLNRR